MAFVNQPLGDRLARELRSADGDVGPRVLLQSLNRSGVELALDSGSLAGYGLKGPGIDNLLGRTPDLRVILVDHGPIVVGLPVDHRLVHAPSVQVSADWP